MNTVKNNAKTEEITREMQAEMDKYGIMRIPVYYFQFRQHKYSNLKDAIAQAERERSVD